MRIVEYGNVNLDINTNAEAQRIRLCNVAFILGLRTNLKSQTLVQRGDFNFEFSATSDEMFGWYNGEKVLTGNTTKTGICELKGIKPIQAENIKVMMSTSNNKRLDLMHKQMCHVGLKTIEKWRQKQFCIVLKTFKH